MQERALRAFEAIQGWLDERTQITERMRFVLYKPVPLHATRFWYCFGGLALVTFIIQLASGAFISFYYVPSTAMAYPSVYYISHDVAYGWFIRSVHYWGAQLMIVMVILHMLRVFYTKSYKAPRELTWISGVLQFVATMGLGLTGYILPWHETAYWAATVASNIANDVPVIGPAIKTAWIGGDKISQVTLSHFFALHVFILPAVLIGVLGLHFYMIRRQGISGPL